MKQLVIFVGAHYEESSTIECQGSYKSIQPYLRQGYYVKEDRNGYWVLIRPTRVLVTLKCSNGKMFCYNMKQDIVDYFGKSRISHRQYEEFCRDAGLGKVKFYIDENGNYSIEW